MLPASVSFGPLFLLGGKFVSKTFAPSSQSGCPCGLLAREANTMNPKDFFRQSKRSQDTWNRVVQAISRMRAGHVSLFQAAHEFGVSPNQVVRLGGSALRKTPKGRYVARPTDDLLRVLSLPGKRGLREIAFNDSREASLVGRYWDAVRLYLQ